MTKQTREDLLTLLGWVAIGFMLIGMYVLIFKGK
jgi:hypothetical protein